MNESDVKRWILALAIQAEIEGMKVQVEYGLVSERYSENDFKRKAEELRILAYAHPDQL